MMKTINVVNGPQNVPAIIQGCMRMPALSVEEAAKVIRNAYDLGVNFYDHATCYRNTASRFSKVSTLSCGIVQVKALWMDLIKGEW